MEFRTQSLSEEGEESGGDSDIVDEFLQRTKKELAKDPEKRVNLAKGLKENYGIDPQITAMFVPGLEEDLQNAQEEMEKVEETDTVNESFEYEKQQSNQMVNNGKTNQSQNQGEEMPQVENELTAENILDIVEELKEYLGEDTTLKELEEMAQNNQTHLEMLIEEKL